MTVRSTITAYGVSLAAVAAAVVVRLLLEPLLGDRLPFITLFVSVVFAAWYGGRGPALGALIAGAFATAYFILQPHYSFAIDQFEYEVGLVLYGVVCVASIAMFESLRKAQRRAEEKQRLLEQEATARRAAEQMLADREELLRITFASIGDGVITTDANGNVTYLNAVAQELTGWTQAEANGKPLTTMFRIINEESRQPVENPVQKALREGKIVGLANHTILISKDGTERCIDDSAAPIRHDDARIVGVVLIFRDISDRRQVEIALQESERRFRNLATAVPSIVWTAAPDGTITYANARWSEYCGQTEEDNSRQRLELVIHPDDRQRSVEAWTKALREGTDYQIEVRNRRHDGVYRWFATKASPLKDEQGRVVAWFGVSTDIHDQMEVQEQLRDADRRKDEFLATLAHEIRNPLAPVKNSLELIKRASGDADLIEQARSTMERQIGQMVRLIDDLLDVSRITRNKLELKTERVELASIVHHAVEACRPHSERAGHELNVTLPPEPIYLHADPIRLAQVFGNLLNNSAKYTEPGGRIWLTAERQGSDVAVRVKDTGVGIPPEMLPKVFDLFTQVDRSLERSEGGLGIGLSLVKRLVELHGGTVKAHSEGQGLGSEFVVRLPVLLEIPKAQPLPEPTGEPIPTTVRRILVVDDNRDGTDSLARLLELTGNDTQTAHDGVEAVEKAAAFRPDVILLDIGLPKMSGYEACRAIREQPWGKDIVIVAMTGWGQEEDRRKSNEAGFNSHMVKPVDHAALMTLLASLSLGDKCQSDRRSNGWRRPI